MKQSKKRSLEEALANAVVGFIIGIALNMLALPILLDIPFETIDLTLAIYISLLYGGLSIIRSFILRRVYNSNRRWRFW
jgi:hypothetical protein